MKDLLNFIKKIIIPLLFPLLLLFIWETLHVILIYFRISSGKLIIFPAPTTILLKACSVLQDINVLKALLSTTLISVLGMSLGIIGSIVLGIILGGSIRIDKYIGATIHFLRTLPVITYVPLTLVLWGADIRSPLFLIGFVSSLYGALPIANSVAEYDREKKIFLRDRGLSSINIALWYILPEIFAALKASLSAIVTLSVAICVISEMLMPSLGGIGYWLLRSKEISDYKGLWAFTLILGLLGFSLHFIIIKVWEFVTPWSKSKGR